MPEFWRMIYFLAMLLATAWMSDCAAVREFVGVATKNGFPGAPAKLTVIGCDAVVPLEVEEI